MKLNALIDNGSDINVLQTDLWSKIQQNETTEQKNQLEVCQTTLRGFGGCSLIRPLGQVTLKTRIDGEEYQLVFIVIPNVSPEDKMIIGDPLRDQATILLGREEASVTRHGPVRVDHVRRIEVKPDEMQSLLRDVPEEFRQELQFLVKGYRPLSCEKPPVRKKSVLKDETPIWRHPAKLSPKEKSEVDAQIEEWLQAGVIVESTSEFASQVVVARKKDGRARVCINFKPLNKVIVKEHTPQAPIEDCLDEIADGVVYCGIDLKDGYFHIEVEEESRKYTSFVGFINQGVRFFNQ